MGNGKSLQKIVKLRKLAKLVKIRETAAIPAELAKNEKTKQNKTDTPQKKSQKRAKKKDEKNAKQCEKNKKIHHKLPLNVNGKSGQKLLDCRCRRCSARVGELPNCWRWKELWLELQKDVSRWNWRQRRPKRNVQLNKNQSGLRYQRRFSVGVPWVPPLSYCCCCCCCFCCVAHLRLRLRLPASCVDSAPNVCIISTPSPHRQVAAHVPSPFPRLPRSELHFVRANAKLVYAADFYGGTSDLARHSTAQQSKARRAASHLQIGQTLTAQLRLELGHISK